MQGAYIPPNKVKWNILVFPAGTENALEIWRSLKDTKEVRLFGAASPGVHHGPYVFQTCYEIPDVRTEKWHLVLNQLIQELNIDFIIPANDIVIDALTQVRHYLKAPVLMPENDVIARVQSKRETLEMLSKDVNIPRVYKTIKDVQAYPVFVKPNQGYGSQGAQIVENEDNLLEICTKLTDPLIEEYLPGEEVSVDCFTDRHGKVRFSGARSRQRVRMGTSMHSDLLPPEEQTFFRHVAETISARLRVKGIWFFQFKKNVHGKWCLLEVDTRVAGTMGLNRVRGVNFPLLAIMDAAGLDFEIAPPLDNVTIDRCLLNRYKHTIDYHTVYVDLDDTIIVDQKLNIDMVRFLYQSFNKQIKLVLLTKSLAPDVHAYLDAWRIRQIFDEIIVLPEDDSKAAYITDKNSIFIDDSFSARREVRQKLGIATFDPSMVEMLLDDRI